MDVLMLVSFQPAIEERSNQQDQPLEVQHLKYQQMILSLLLKDY